jgi:hypothetical protein
MSLVAGADGDKSVFKDGLQVDHISENTVGHGARVRGISDPTTYPVLLGDIGDMVSATWSSQASNTSTYISPASIIVPAGVWDIMVGINVAGGGSVTGLEVGASTDSVSTTFSDRDLSGFNVCKMAVAGTSGGGAFLSTPYRGTGTTFYAKVKSLGAGDTTYGRIWAIRRA